MAREIEVVPYDPNWVDSYKKEVPRLFQALGENVLAIHHAGSTAVPGIKAKPTIDLLVEVADIQTVDERNASMETLGYEPRGEYGIPKRRYFIRREKEKHTHHVHVFPRGSPEVDRMLLFRDYLIAHPTEAQAYSRLKEELAQAFRLDSVRYTDGKEAFIREIDEKARQWASGTGWKIH
jgi:GrpB-like predicted nucleotidyltransferase (UPF0157 family)